MVPKVNLFQNFNSVFNTVITFDIYKNLLINQIFNGKTKLIKAEE